MGKQPQRKDDIKVGSKVAIFLEEGWRLAEVTAIDGDTYTVQAPWDMKPTVTRDKLILLGPKPDLKEEINVFAYSEADGSFLQGYVTGLNDKTATIVWSDGHQQPTDVPIELIITDTVAICGEDLNVVEEDTRVQLYYKGSNVGLIEDDGSIWLRNKTVGRINADYEVYDASSTKLGYYSDGNMYKDGQVVGYFNEDGTVRISATSADGKIETDGTISLNNTEIGKAEGLDPINAAMIYFFFFDMIQ